MAPHSPATDSRTLGLIGRTFALSLRALPADLRAPVQLAYLLARAADTAADRPWIPAGAAPTRLAELRAALGGGTLGAGDWTALAACAPSGDAVAAAEARLLAHTPSLLADLPRLPDADRADVAAVVDTLIATMQDELRRFPRGAPLAALPDAAALVAYTDGIAGCVGVFWTRLLARRAPGLPPATIRALERAGRRYGRGLQLVNILRDLPRDLRRGRCFLPADELAAAGLAPADLLDPARLPQARSVLACWEALAHRGLLGGLLYTARLPRRPWRLRVATALPARLGLLTLERLARAPERLDPSRPVRISRSDVRRALASSGFWCAFRRGPLRLAAPRPR